MKKLLSALFLLVSHFLSAQTGLQPTDTEALVNFVVTDEKSTPILKALVKLESMLDKVEKSDSTNKEGIAGMLLKKGSVYKLRVESGGKVFSFGEFEVPKKDGKITMEEVLQITSLSVRHLNIQFSPNKAELFEAAKVEVDKLYQELLTNPGLKIEVAGHTDNIGDDQQNMILSHKRANAIRDYLIQKGISDKRIRAKGYGESTPIADNSTEEGRFRNRRIEVRTFN